MEEFFGCLPVSNAMSICVGGITNSELERARADGIDIDGNGYFLFLASNAEPSQPIEVLAKFSMPSAAEKLARLMTWAEARTTF